MEIELARVKTEKALGCDLFNAAVLNTDSSRFRVAKDMANIINLADFPPYFKECRV